MLGSIVAERDAVPVALGGARQRRLLAILLVHRGETVSRDQISEAVFGDDPPAGAEATLRTYVSRLRRALAPVGASIVAAPPGYRLVVERDALDAGRFEELAVRVIGVSGTPDGEVATTVRLCREALALWRGRPWAEFADESWVAPEADRLVALRGGVRERLVDGLLAAGEPDVAAAELTPMVAEEPFRESWTVRRMLALYRAGRVDAALAAYGEAAALLREELGVDPSPELADMQRRVLQRDEGLDDGTGDRWVRGYLLGERLGLGRSGEVRAASRRLTRERLVLRVVPTAIADHPDFVRTFTADVRRLTAVAGQGHAVVPVRDAWREPGEAFVVTERFFGGDLDGYLRSGRLSRAALLELVDRVGGALLAAVRQGLRHGRLGAGSVLLDEAERPFLHELALGEAALRPGDDAADLLALVRDAATRSALDLPGLTGISLPRLGGPVERVSTVLDGLRHVLGRRGAGSAPANPYVGLRAYHEVDAERFFGRETVAQHLARRLSSGDPEDRTVLLVGPSGSGKSSVVRAGVVPRLRDDAGRDSWLVAVLYPGLEPGKELAEALRRVAVADSATALEALARDEVGLAQVLPRLLAPGDRLLVVVDQAEELFALGPDVADRFLLSLTEAVSGDPRVAVICTLRADFYHRPLRLRGFARHVPSATVVLPPPTPLELARAVTGPARLADLVLEPGLVDDLVREAEGTGSLPALQFALFELARRGGRGLVRRDLADLGGLEGAVAARAEHLMAPLADQEVDRVRTVLGRLVTVDDEGSVTRRRAPVAEVAAGDPARAAVIEAWVQARVFTTDCDPRSREPTVEICHDALLTRWPRLARWIEEDRDRLVAVRQLREAADRWEHLHRDDGALWRGVQLARADAIAPDDMPPGNASEFLLRSRELESTEARAQEERVAEQARANRRLRRHRSVLAAAVVLLAVASAVVLDQRRAAREAADEAAARARAATVGLLSASDATRREDWSLSLLLALEAHRVQDSPTTREALLAVLTDPRPVPHRQHLHDAGYVTLALDKGSGTLVVKDPAGRVDVLDAKSGQPARPSFDSPPSVRRGGLDVTGRHVASGGVVTEDRIGAVVLDLATGRTAEVPAAPREMVDVAFSPDGGQLAVTGDGRVRILDPTDAGAVRTLRAPNGLPVISAAWAPGGRRLYGGTIDGKALVWAIGEDGAAPRHVVRASDKQHQSPVVALAPAAEGGLVAAATVDDGIALLDPRSLADTGRRLTAGGPVLDLAASPDGRELAVAASNAIERWSLSTLTPPERLEELPTDGVGAAYLGVGGVVTAGIGGAVTRWELDPPVPGLEPVPAADGGWPSFSPDGGLLAAWGGGRGVRLLDGQTLRPAVELDVARPGRTSFSGVAFVPGTARLVTLSCRGPSNVFDRPCRGELRVHDTATGAVVDGPVRTGPIVPWVSQLVAVSGDGKYVATGHVDGVVEVRELDRLDDARTLAELDRGEQNFVTQVSFTPRDVEPARLVATTGDLAEVWSVPDWGPLAAARTGVTAAFTPSGRILTSDQDGTVRVRDEVLDVVDEYVGLDQPAIAPAFSADGSWMVSVDDFTLAPRIWQLDPLSPVGGPVGAERRALGVAVSPDGDRVVLGGEPALLLRLDPEAWVRDACLAAGRNLTRREWLRYLGEERYRRTCALWPAGA